MTMQDRLNELNTDLEKMVRERAAKNPGAKRDSSQI